jgi:prepilin-type N-terminal cleavage/methylation domain-containing protein
MKTKGFTFIELLITLVIAAIELLITLVIAAIELLITLVIAAITLIIKFFRPKTIVPNIEVQN